MADVIVKAGRWKNGGLEIDVWWIQVGKKFWFFGREVAEALGYTDPPKAIQTRITDPEDKKTMEEIVGVNYRRILERSLKLTMGKMSTVDFFRRARSSQKLISEFALYHFCGTSKKDKAKPFHKWVFNTIVEIRETGTYTLPCGPIDNPLDLIARAPTLERKKIETRDKATQTKTDFTARDIIIKKSLKKLGELEKSIVRVEIDLENCLKSDSSTGSNSSDSD